MATPDLSGHVLRELLGGTRELQLFVLCTGEPETQTTLTLPEHCCPQTARPDSEARRQELRTVFPVCAAAAVTLPRSTQEGQRVRFGMLRLEQNPEVQERP